jgi:hypothetical protein
MDGSPYLVAARRGDETAYRSLTFTRVNKALLLGVVNFQN